MHNLFGLLAGLWMGITSFMHGGQANLAKANTNSAVLHAAVTGTPTGGPRKGGMPNAMRSIKGTKLADNKFLSPHAYQIFPVDGQLSADAQAATNGWTINSTVNSDGSTEVTLTPANSETEDHKQEFTITQGERLYFVELNLKDDVNGQDENPMDDLGIIVDANGVIQNDLPKPSFPAGGFKGPRAQVTPTPQQ